MALELQVSFLLLPICPQSLLALSEVPVWVSAPVSVPQLLWQLVAESFVVLVLVLVFLLLWLNLWMRAAIVFKGLVLQQVWYLLHSRMSVCGSNLHLEIFVLELEWALRVLWLGWGFIKQTDWPIFEAKASIAERCLPLLVVGKGFQVFLAAMSL